MQLKDNSVMHYTICKAQVHTGVMPSTFSVLMNQFFKYGYIIFHYESLGLPRLSSLASPFPSAKSLHHFALFRWLTTCHHTLKQAANKFWL
jgi:hypothetical protein